MPRPIIYVDYEPSNKKFYKFINYTIQIIELPVTMFCTNERYENITRMNVCNVIVFSVILFSRSEVL